MFADVLERHDTLLTRVLTFIEDWQGRCQCPACSEQFAKPFLATNYYSMKGGLWQALAV